MLKVTESPQPAAVRGDNRRMHIQQVGPHRLAVVFPWTTLFVERGHAWWAWAHGAWPARVGAA